MRVTSLLLQQKNLKKFNRKEEFLIDFYYHIHLSCKRKDEVREAMQFCEVDVRKVLKHVETRWSSLSKCLERSLAL